MIQSFQCPVCGTLNAIGEPECTNCGQGFVYNCPVCGSPLNNRYPNCPNCRTVFNWAVSSPQGETMAGEKSEGRSRVQQEPARVSQPARQPGRKGVSIAARPMFWVMLIVICAILIALLLIAGGLMHA